MIQFKTLFPRDLYHSYIVEGEPDIVAPELYTYLSSHSSDILFQTYNSFTKDDGPIIQEWHSTKGNTDGKRMCILSAKFINHDAERTLLKMIEEPSENTHFFLVVPNADNLLDTIRSRTHTIRVSSNESTSKGKEFIGMSVRERLDMVARLIETHKDDEESGARRYEATNLLNEIERNLYEKFQVNKKDEGLQFALIEIQKGREYMSTPGAAVKMILEHIALVI